MERIRDEALRYDDGWVASFRIHPKRLTDALATFAARVEAAALRERDEAMAALRAVLAPVLELAAKAHVDLRDCRAVDYDHRSLGVYAGEHRWVATFKRRAERDVVVALVNALSALLKIADQSAATAPAAGDAPPIRARASERPAVADGNDSSMAGAERPADADATRALLLVMADEELCAKVLYDATLRAEKINPDEAATWDALPEYVADDACKRPYRDQAREMIAVLRSLRTGETR